MLAVSRITKGYKFMAGHTLIYSLSFEKSVSCLCTFVKECVIMYSYIMKGANYGGK